MRHLYTASELHVAGYRGAVPQGWSTSHRANPQRKRCERGKRDRDRERERGDKRRTGHSLCFLRCELGEFWANDFRMERKSLDATPGLVGR